MRIVYLCPARDTPIGGVKVIHRHAEALVRLGADVFVLHPEDPAFRCTWFAHAARFLDGMASVRPDDLVVVPEVWAGSHGLTRLRAGGRYAVFVQNGYLTHPFLPGETADGLQPAYAGAELVLAISDDSAAMVRMNHPGIDPARLMRVTYVVDARLFAAGEAGSRTIAYMPRKATEFAGRVVFALSRHLPAGWRLAPIDGVSEAECAARLRAASVFLAFGEYEGLPMPPVEAALAGCVVVGCTGQGGAEYWDAPNFDEVAQGDVIGFVDRVLGSIARIEDGSLGAGVLAPGIAALSARFSTDAQSEGLRRLLERCRPAG